MTAPADRLRKARIERGFASAADAARAFGWNVNTYSSNENGNAPFSYKKAQRYGEAFGVRAEWLLSGEGDMAGQALVPIIGFVGADNEGRIMYASGQGSGDRAPLPPGGSGSCSAVEVRGYSMKGFADDGSLIYFEEQHSKPTRDMIGQVVVVQTKSGDVLVKRLLKGSRAGRYDLESIVGPTLEDIEIEWVALVSAIIPAARARQLIIRSGTQAA